MKDGREPADSWLYELFDHLGGMFDQLAKRLWNALWAVVGMIIGLICLTWLFIAVGVFAVHLLEHDLHSINRGTQRFQTSW